MHCGYLKEEGDKMEHLERHGFLRRGIARHARLSLQLRNQSVRPRAQSAVLAAPQLAILATRGGLQAPGSRLSRLLAALRTTRDEPLGRSAPSGRLRCGRGPRTKVAHFVAFNPQVLGFVYNSTLSLRLRRKRNTSILVEV